jgi:glutamine synthetase
MRAIVIPAIAPAGYCLEEEVMSQKWTKTSIKEFVEREKIQAIWHWFVDLEGQLKGFAITPRELDRSLEDGMHFDGSSISGFNAIEESDLVARPDLSTFAVLPENADTPRSARFFCDIETPRGEPYERDPRQALKRVIAQANSLGFTPYMGPEIEFFIFKSPGATGTHRLRRLLHRPAGGSRQPHPHRYHYRPA